MPKIGTFDVDPAKRRLLTPQNLVELGITPASVQLILTANLPSLERTIVVNGAVVKLWPQGLSINETNFGNYTGPTAAALGWMSYLEIGAPLVEERADIIQPQADVLSTRAYENRSTTGADRGFSDTIGFSIENTISWSLEGTSQFTFEGHISAELQAQLALSLAQSLAHSVADSTSHTDILHNHRDNVGTETQDQTTTTTTDTTTNTTTYTGTGTGTGAAGLSAQLMLGITGSVSGTLTTSWNSSSTVSGNVPAGSRVETMATQRRQVRQYIYELPITFAGFVALQYAQPVPVFAEADNPQPGSTPATQVVARGITALGLVKDGQYYLPKGVAETVSTLEVEHIVFDSKSIPPAPNQTFGTVRPHNLQAS